MDVLDSVHVGETERTSGVEVNIVGEARRSILVIDDQQIILDLLKRVLSHEGYSVSTACRADEAMAEVCAGSFDLAITDVDLVLSDGCELMRMIGEKSPHTALVAMTGNVEERVVCFARDHTDGLLLKPFPLHRLLTVVRTAMEARMEHARQVETVSSASPHLRVGAQA